MSYYLKDPIALVGYSFDWGQNYLDGQTVSQSAWNAAPQETGGLTIASTGFTTTGTSAQLSGGVPGHLYRVTNQVTFSDGTSDERQITLRVEER